MSTAYRRRLVSILFLAFFVVAGVLAASLPEKWNSWKYLRDISNAHPGSLNYVTIGPSVLTHSNQAISDLRILDESDAETPYVLRTSIGVTKTQSWAATIRENSFVPGKYTQLVLDLGTYPRFHNAVQLQTPESDFILWAEVDASDDARTWRIVKERAPISRFRKEGLEGNQTLHYSENNARYLRIRIAESSHQFPVTSAAIFPSSLAQREIIPEQSIPIRLRRIPESDPSAQITVWTLDLGTANVPVNSLEFETPKLEFFRGVRISASDDGKEWSPVGGGEIYRYQTDPRLEESLRVPVYGYGGRRYLRVEVLNGDDAPLPVVSLTASMVPHLILFRPAAGHSYRLIYGNERAQAPNYDLQRTLHISASEEAFADELRIEQQNGGYQDPRPFSEKHPAVLWGSLALAAVLLGYTALRTLRTPPVAPAN